MYNSIVFIGNADNILSEEYYMDTEEKLSFFTTFFKKKNENIYQVVSFMYRTEKNVRSSRQIFVWIIEL